ncbi:hypothetical protein AAHB37_16560 [Glutamicibacter halophytocola]|uniref:hypothetical protein n=1 Tax=Glutamicibacter halophytocola TaxID=1933880 RepID=UPI0032194073
MPANRTRSERASSLTPFQKILLNTCAVLGTLCLAMAVLALVFGFKPLVFASGSMSPGIPTGSLGLAVPATVQEVVVGDVVSVVNSGNQRITHRVVEKVPGGLVLKGGCQPRARCAGVPGGPGGSAAGERSRAGLRRFLAQPALGLRPRRPVVRLFALHRLPRQRQCQGRCRRNGSAADAASKDAAG